MKSKKHRGTTQKGTAVAVIGLGYVGLPLALLADRKGNRVIGIDSDAGKIELIARRESPILDAKLSRLLSRSQMEPSTDFARLKGVSIIVLCVPTPVHEDHRPDLTPLTAACELVASYLQKGHLVILESTVNPGVCESIVLPLLERGSALKGGRDFDLAHCPERINPGDKYWDVEKIPRVLGGLTEGSLRRAFSFYTQILRGAVKPMGSLKEAEAVKIVENTFRDVNIAFVNELAVSFSRLGIDITRVIEGAATKPFGFMPFYPGAGVGGHCIPVDPYYLIEYARERGFQHRFLSLAREINEDMPKFVVERLEKMLTPLKGVEVAVLGMAYKPDVDDARESPSIQIIRLLAEKGARVRVFDPYIQARSNAPNLYAALHRAKAVVVATAHSEFRTLRPSDFLKHGIRVVVDGRNCLPKEEFLTAGISYSGIGR